MVFHRQLARNNWTAFTIRSRKMPTLPPPQVTPPSLILYYYIMIVNYNLYYYLLYYRETVFSPHPSTGNLPTTLILFSVIFKIELF